MILVDSSFAIEWFLGKEVVSNTPILGKALGILPQQFTEILVFFGKRINDLSPIIHELEPISLIVPEKVELYEACYMYLEIKKRKPKISLADAICAAVAKKRKYPIATFDLDFQSLGFSEKDGLWYFA